MRYWRKRYEGLDLEAELRASRPSLHPSSSTVSRRVSEMTVVAPAQARFASSSSVQ